ncbi:MAG: hypothetical protein VR72_07895 [Clostridiaceae bacterium BRH_c20a]|nr:MAG: hypothetical protein VR72_07895 [Clostridiaceae bacterium BRH_c20a]
MSHVTRESLQSIKKSGVKMQLLLFFYNNPFTVDDLEGISMWVGMHKKEITREMEELCQMRLLVKRGTSHSYYRMTENSQLVEEVQKLIKEFYAQRKTKAS